MEPQVQPMRTVLLIKEIKDKNEDFVNMDPSEMKQFKKKQAQEAYKALVRATKPTFSGSIDHRINLLEFRKVAAVLDLDSK